MIGESIKHLRHFLCAFITIGTLLLATNCHAKVMRALLVGVSEYPKLSKQLQLKGPRNDVLHVVDVLNQRGFAHENITVLADGVDGAALPTRKNILEELVHLANTANKDDFVFLYFAGHGSQQPAFLKTGAGQAEENGLYETFLPRDIGQWDGSFGTVENAIIKTELRDAVDRITAKGAFVWAIFDTCHSATLVRGETTGVMDRYVNPATLGVPENMMKMAKQRELQTASDLITKQVSEKTTSNTTDSGGSVFFYATQASQGAPEIVLPKGRVDGKSLGLFSYTVMQALETGVPMTYRQLSQYVLTRYGEMNETLVTPLFSGTALDQPVFFQNAQLVRQWKINHEQELIVQAGALSGLDEGAILAVMPDPLAKIDDTVGYIKLKQVGLATSIGLPIAYNGKQLLNPNSLKEGSYARLVQNMPQYSLRVAVDAKECEDSCAANAVIEKLRKVKSSVPGTTIQWVDYPATGDVILKLLPDRILLLPPSMQGVACVKANTIACQRNATFIVESKNARLQEELAVGLHAVARTVNLLRIASRLGEANTNKSMLEVKLKVVKKDHTELPINGGQVANLSNGDIVDVSLANAGTASVDVTMLFVDARYGINVLYPHGPGASNRLEPRSQSHFGVAINDNTLGLERMLTIAVEAGSEQERADFSFLAQSPLEFNKSVKRNESDPDAMAFMDAGYAAYQTRGDHNAPQVPSSKTSMQVFTLNVEH